MLANYFNPCCAAAKLKPVLISKVDTEVHLTLVAASLAAEFSVTVDPLTHGHESHGRESH